MKGKKLIVLALMLCLSLTACSTVETNSAQYFSQLTTRLSSWSNKIEQTDSSESSTADDGTTPLATPGDFRVGADGSYSFTGVENADYYIIYMYDADSDSSEYAYISTNIDANDSNTYSGMLTDFNEYAYANYRVEVIAYPSITDKENRASEAASCDYLKSGEVDAPQLAYKWDYFSGELEVQLINIESYQLTSYPTLLEVTLTSTADSSDVMTASAENLSLDDDLYSVIFTDVTTDATYSISANVSWNEELVTNPSATVDVGTVTVKSNENAISEGFGYQNSSVYSSFDFPVVALNFDPTVGGDIGVWYQYTAMTVSRSDVTPASFGTDNVYFTAEPIEANSGALYSFKTDAKNASGVLSLGWGAEADSATGTLDIFADGTFTLTIDYQYLGTDPISSAKKELYASQINGTWTENDDGTLNLSYDRSTAVLTGNE